MHFDGGDHVGVHRAWEDAVYGYFATGQTRAQRLTRVRLKSSIAISGALAIREAALRGMGPVMLADWLVRADIADGKLISVLNDYQVTAEDFDTAAWLIYPSRHFLPNKTRVMIDFLKGKFPGK